MLLSGLVLTVLWMGCLSQGTDQIMEPPKIKVPERASTKYVGEGKATDLNCSATGTPTPTYTWKVSKDSGTTWKPIELVPNLVSFSSRDGHLKMASFTKEQEGMYLCVAKNRFQTPMGNSEAASFSPIITVKMNIITPFKDQEDAEFKAKEFSYYKMQCMGKGEIQGVFDYSWFQNNNQINSDEPRFFVDADGNLHIAYVTLDDDSDRNNIGYKCAYKVEELAQINLMQSVNKLNVEKELGAPSATKPNLVYTNMGIKGHVEALLNTPVDLECMFSGYDPNGSTHMPEVTWMDNNLKPITSDGINYEVTQLGRRLKIMSVKEKHEGNFVCVGKNSAGEEQQYVTVKVVSPPIFDETEDRPHDMVLPELGSVTLNCNARSANNDPQPVNTPIWFINGNEAGDHLEQGKYEFSRDHKQLTIHHLTKATDNMCVQCSVKNLYGITMEDGCLTVIEPIRTIPASLDNHVSVEYGDWIDMTVTATSDKQFPNLHYRWFFNNETHDKDWMPQWMQFNPNTNTAFINTSKLTEEEYQGIAGTYIRKIWHLHQEVNVTFTLSLDDPEPVPIVQSASFDMWILGLIVGIIFLIIVVIIIIFIICRKQQEGDYNVDKKEHGAGLDPEKELKNKGFDDYSRPDYSDYEYPDRKPRGDLEYDDVPIGGDDESLGEYGDEATYFNEDGSFIGIYQKKEKPKNNHATESTI